MNNKLRALISAQFLRTAAVVNIYTFSSSERFWDQLAGFASLPETAPVFRDKPGLPMVKNWARPGYEYVEMLRKITPIEVHPNFADIPGNQVLSRMALGNS